MTFAEFEINEQILKAIKELGYETPTEIQEKAIPILLDYEADFVGQAQTGTGKTAAFGIPLLQAIDFDSKNIQAFILAPTRELAHQVCTEIQKFAKYLPLRTATIYGGVSYDKQIRDIKKLRPHIVVGTPGRTIDLINKNILDLAEVKSLIIDEADEMLNMGFLEDVEIIIKSLHKNKKTWMFSATMPKEILRLIERDFDSPYVLKTKKKTVSNENIDQRFCVVKRKFFHEALIRIIECESNFYGIAFCETKRETQEVADKLSSHGMDVVALHGDLSQYQRDAAMLSFKKKKNRLLVCTDVAARGIDVSDITHVINLGIPRNNENYVHRIGRTARAGTKGISITLITPFERRDLKRLEYLTKAEITPIKLPDAAEIKKGKVKGEIEKMQTLKEAILGKGDDFKIDSSFGMFQEDFKDLNREEILRLFFTWSFNKTLRQIDDLGALEAQDGRDDERSSRGPRRRDDRRGPRSGGDSRRRDSRGGDSRGPRSGGNSRGGNFRKKRSDSPREYRA